MSGRGASLDADGFATNFPMNRRMTLAEVSECGWKANAAVGNRPVDKASFEYGYWIGAHDALMVEIEKRSPRQP